MQVMRYVFVVTFFSLLGLLRSVTSEQTCYDGPDAVIVNEDADVYIGKIMTQLCTILLYSICIFLLNFEDWFRISDML